MPKVRMYSVPDKRYCEFHWNCNPSPEYCSDCSLNNQCDKEPDDKDVKEVEYDKARILRQTEQAY